MPLLDCAKHIITRQTFHSSLISVENASWPHWFFSRDHLIAQISMFGDVIYQWNTPTESLLFEGKQIVLEGFLIKTKGAIRSKKNEVNT